jgi:hypothetical protein
MMGPLPVALPLPRNRMIERCASRQKILFAVTDTAIVFTPSHFIRVGRQIRTRDVVMVGEFAT